MTEQVVYNRELNTERAEVHITHTFYKFDTTAQNKYDIRISLLCFRTHLFDGDGTIECLPLFEVSRV